MGSALNNRGTLLDLNCTVSGVWGGVYHKESEAGCLVHMLIWVILLDSLIKTLTNSQVRTLSLKAKNHLLTQSSV